MWNWISSRFWRYWSHDKKFVKADRQMKWIVNNKTNIAALMTKVGTECTFRRILEDWLKFLNWSIVHLLNQDPFMSNSSPYSALSLTIVLYSEHHPLLNKLELMTQVFKVFTSCYQNVSNDYIMNLQIWFSMLKLYNWIWITSMTNSREPNLGTENRIEFHSFF